MKVVGLLSGGKDSVYNLLHAIANGHEPIALASLGPGDGKDELDSYMYQTVGHSGLASIAEALDLPLFTHTISGTAVNLGGEYGSRGGGKVGGTEGDETEDLVELLRKVKEAMPEVEAVACGAILSNYQRVRVEHVCSRLKLTPIAYLWERNQAELLQEMVEAGMESVLVKVAGAGLGVEHLGKSLKQMEPTLLRLNAKYHLHVCGEGGEYETFTVDCPLFRKRVVLDKTATVVSNPDPFSTVAHLHLDTCTLADKPDYSLNETWEEKRSRIRKVLGIPPLLDDEAQEAREDVRAVYGLDALPIEMQTIVGGFASEEGLRKPSVSRKGDWLAFAEVTAYSEAPGAVLSLEDEVKGCFTNLEALLRPHSATLLSLTHLTLYLSPTSMSLFPAINAVYSSYFGSSPPTRACVSILFDPSSLLRLKLEGIARLSSDAPRKVLHVQSLSYWAAANIGPYSQSVVTGDKLFVAGQIALVPASLTLPTPFDFPTEVALSLQHVGRVVAASEDGRWKGESDGGLCWIAEDAGEGTGGDGGEWGRRMKAARAVGKAAFGEVLYVSAATLPKGASVEWQVTFTREVEEPDSDDEEAVAKLLQWRGPMGIVTRRAGQVELATGIDTKDVLLIRAFHRPSVPVSEVLQLAAATFGGPVANLPALSTIAATFLATRDEEDVDIAFVLLGAH